MFRAPDVCYSAKIGILKQITTANYKFNVSSI